MYIKARPRTASISYTADGNKTSAILRFNLVPTDEAAVLEIGEKHVFALRRKRPFLGFLDRRRDCLFSLSVHRKSELPAKESEKLGLSNAKIGELVFEPPEKKNKRAPALRAFVFAQVYVSDELHESLRNLLQAEKNPTWLRLSLGIEWIKEGGLKYGWEPDASRMVWKVQNANEPSHIGVTSLYIDAFRCGPLLSLLNFALGGWRR